MLKWIYSTIEMSPDLSYIIVIPSLGKTYNAPSPKEPPYIEIAWEAWNKGTYLKDYQGKIDLLSALLADLPYF